MNYKDNEFDVIIVGGGITGAGTARDCALRGLRVLLIERHDIATGATGRNHGLLHSGARYAVTDKESATECIEENMILRRIARHCVDETEGFFITLPEDDLAYQAKFVESCTAAGIRAEVIDPKEAIRLAPSVNPDLIGAVRVPDGSDSLGNDDLCHIRVIPVQGFIKRGFGLQIQRGSDVVQDQDLTFIQQCPGDGDALTLPAG